MAVLALPVARVTVSREVPGVRVAVVLLGPGCTAATFTLYYSLIAHVEEARATLGNYLTPIFALV